MFILTKRFTFFFFVLAIKQFSWIVKLKRRGLIYAQSFLVTTKWLGDLYSSSVESIKKYAGRIFNMIYVFEDKGAG